MQNKIKTMNADRMKTVTGGFWLALIPLLFLDSDQPDGSDSGSDAESEPGAGSGAGSGSSSYYGKGCIPLPKF
jgi:hypothetical protein